MSQTSDKRRRTELDLFMLALINGGITTPYALQKSAGLSQGATIPRSSACWKRGLCAKEGLAYGVVLATK